MVRRALLLAGERLEIGPDEIAFDSAARMIEPPAQFAPTDAPASAESLSEIARNSEASAIISVLEECGGRRNETARRLGISERTLRYRLADMRDAGIMPIAAAAGAGR